MVQIILLLVDHFGCNVNLTDRHGRRPLELLIQTKNVRGGPSATQLKEETLIERREAVLDRWTFHSNCLLF